MTKDIDEGYVKYIVNKYLRRRPNLEEYRNDLLQEGLIALLRVDEDFDASYGVDKKLYAYYAIKRAIFVYIRSEARHFKKKDVDYESPYWDLTDYQDVEDLVDLSLRPLDELRLHDITDKLTLTERQREVLNEYLRSGDYTECARSLGISRQRVHEIVSDIIEKAQKYLDK